MYWFFSVYWFFLCSLSILLSSFLSFSFWHQIQFYSSLFCCLLYVCNKRFQIVNCFGIFFVLFTELLHRDILTPGILHFFSPPPMYNKKLNTLDEKHLLFLDFCESKLTYQIQMHNMQHFICSWLTPVLQNHRIIKVENNFWDHQVQPLTKHHRGHN